MDTTITPMLSVQDVTAAVDFYQRAFGADLVARHGPVVELAIEGSRFYAVAEDPERAMCRRAPTAARRRCGST